MSNLFNLGRTGLNAAQAGINTTGHNIANVNTPGYSRQQAMLSTAGGQGSTQGYFGRGVQVDTVRRIYDSFLTEQHHSSLAKSSALDTYATQLNYVNNLLADRTVGIAPALVKFFEGINAVASAPADPAGRQELLGRANSLVTQLQTANRFLAEQQESVNQQLSTTVDQINSYAARINDLNEAIVKARATVAGQPPNDLLDQRDQLVAELNKLVRVDVVQEGDRIGLSIGNGQTLLAGGQVYALATMRSASDPERLALAYTMPDGTRVELRDNVVDGGALGGLLQYRSEALDVTQNELGRIAIGLALAFNEQHAQGVDTKGDPGGDFFSLQPATPISNERNDPATTTTMSLQYVDANRLTTHDYTVTWNGAAYEVKRGDGVVVPLEAGSDAINGPLVFDGVQLDVAGGTPAMGDSWLVQPTRNGARDIDVAISDPGAIAAAGPGGGSANNENALALAQLQSAKTLGGGTMSLTEAFSQLVNGVGVKTQAVQTASKAQDTLTAQAFAAQQAVSGVNLNEEYINLDYYVQQYNASARLIDVANSLFDTVLGLGT